MKMRKREASLPSACGFGLIALDIVVAHGGSRTCAAGGTCGNVLTILAYLGWNSYPVSRLADDGAGKLVAADLQRWGVRTNYLRLNPVARTPVVVERLSVDTNGVPHHSYRFNCPECGGRLPSYQPVTLRSVEAATTTLAKMNVVFIDRVSPAAIKLAEIAHENGALIYFEPCSVRDERQFRKVVSLAHIIKYAQDRILDLNEICDVPRDILEIQTLGRGGLRFRFCNSDWHSATAWPVQNLIDAAGSGDWLSAVLIHLVGGRGPAAFLESSFEDILQAINAGQAAAAWNCGFIGPRGGMYQSPRADFLKVVQEAYKSNLRWAKVESIDSFATELFANGICESCSANSRPLQHRRYADRALT